MLKIFCIFAANFFILIAFLIRFFGLGVGEFENTKIVNKYFTYKFLAKNELKDNTIKAVIIVPEKKLQLIKILKKPIGMIQIEGKWRAIDSEGQIFDMKNEKEYENLISISGNFQKWPKIEEKLTKLRLINKIYHVKIRPYETELWLHPGVLVKICDNFENLKDFALFFPQFFVLGNVIDLRHPKHVGISKLTLPQKDVKSLEIQEIL